MSGSNTKVSKFLSLILRRPPEHVGLVLRPDGWVLVSKLLEACAKHGFPLTKETLEIVVNSNDKQRFAFSDDHLMIRASHGHSVKVDLELESIAPPSFLYHGTAELFIASITQQRLLKGNRNHVHLSEREATAIEVGRRYGKPVLLTIASERRVKDGHLFFRSANGVWLTEHVPVNYITFTEPQAAR